MNPMDVQQLSQYLEDLLIDNDRVSLFGIGSFVAENSSAFFSGDGKSVFPPERKLTFKPSETWDDGMIAYLHQRKVGRDLGEVQQEMKNFAEQLQLELRTKKSLRIPGIGELKSTREGNLYFVVDPQLDIDTEGIGLQAIAVKELDQKRSAIRERERTMQDMAQRLPEEYLPELPKPEGEDVPEVLPADGQTPNPVSEQAPEIALSEEKKSRKGLWVVILLVLLIVALCLVLYWPSIETVFEGWLYSEEELRLINSHS